MGKESEQKLFLKGDVTNMVTKRVVYHPPSKKHQFRQSPMDETAFLGV